MPTTGLDTRPRTERLENRRASAWHDLGWLRLISPRSSRFPFQWFWIEVLSFLPKSQHNRRHLARQGQPRHGRLHSARQQILIKLAPRIVSAAGLRGRALEQTLQIMIVIHIETADRRRPLRMLQLSPGVAVFPAAPRLQGQGWD
jgi:hypothetical protein